MSAWTRTPRILRLWLPVAAWMGFIFFLSSIPDLKSPYRLDYMYRKIAHVVEYLVLAVLLARAYRGSGVAHRALYVGLALATAVLYAMTDEYHQAFVPGRRGSWADLVYDSLGSSFGSTLYGLRPACRYAHAGS